MKEYRRSTGTMTALLSGRSTDIRKAEVNRDELTAILFRLTSNSGWLKSRAA
jgi:hypothetical protein